MVATKDERRKSQPEDIFRSDDALDVRWWFQCAAKELGFKSTSFVGSGGGGTKDARCTLMPDGQLLAAKRERRIHAALNLLPAAVYRALELAYANPGYMRDDVGDKLGPYPALAVALSSFIQDGYRGYQRRFKPKVGVKGGSTPMSLELWIVKNVINGKTGVASVIRSETETRLSSALLAYRSVRHPKPIEEREEEKRQLDAEKRTKPGATTIGEMFVLEALLK